MRHDHYILEGKSPKPVSLLTWAQWYETADRQIKHDTVGEIVISTLFIGLNRNWNQDGPPLLFETMVFGGEFDGELHRYSTYGEAEAGHDTIYQKVSSDEAILSAEIIC